MSRIRFDLSRDGWTGEKQDLNCRACGSPLVSKEYILAGRRFWTTIHDSIGCLEKARRLARGCAGRTSPVFKPRDKAARTPHNDP